MVAMTQGPLRGMVNYTEAIGRASCFCSDSDYCGFSLKSGFNDDSEGFATLPAELVPSMLNARNMGTPELMVDVT